MAQNKVLVSSQIVALYVHPRPLTSLTCL